MSGDLPVAEQSPIALERMRDGDALWGRVIARRPEFEIIGGMIRQSKVAASGSYWSPREAVALDWLARAGAWREGEPQTVASLEFDLGVKPGWLARLTRRDHFRTGMRAARKLNRELKAGQRDQSMMERALDPEARDSARFMAMWIEMDREEEGMVPGALDGASWRLTRERQVLEVMAGRPALEASVEEEIGGELRT